MNTSKDSCQWYFHNYSSSQWELEWYSNIEKLQNHICEILTQTSHSSKSIQLLQRVIDLNQNGYLPSTVAAAADNLLSRMYYRQQCVSASGEKYIRLEAYQLIEPLIGLLRDPLTICTFTNDFIKLIPKDLYIHGDEALFSKRHLLLTPAAPYAVINQNNFPKAELPQLTQPWTYKRSQIDDSKIIT
ncbi:unnamed protein product, partial [Didymodactylos carnosus]